MAGYKRIVHTFRRLRVASEAPERPEGIHSPVPACEQFMSIALMSHVKYKPVAAGIEHTVQSDSEFYRSEIRRQVSAVAGNHLDKPPPETGAELLRLLVGNIIQMDLFILL